MLKTMPYIKIFLYIIISIVICSLLVACKTLPEPPISTLYVIDVQNDVCAVRTITDKKTLASKQIDEFPLHKCDGVVGLSLQEYLKLRTWMRHQNAQ